jgi:polyketide cyclase/dehydrase/lipid transport protein
MRMLLVGNLMKAIECAIDIDASPEALFDLIHDYDRRLDWDPFLRKACIVDGSAKAAKGVRTVCCARHGAGGACMETVYVSFDRPHVAAVKMTAGPAYIDDFAASLRQTPVAGGKTRVSYKFQVAGKPRWLGSVLDPMLVAVFRRETRARLEALKAYIERK